MYSQATLVLRLSTIPSIEDPKIGKLKKIRLHLCPLVIATIPSTLNKI